MSIVVPLEGEKALLRKSLRDNLMVHLFENDYTPTESDVVESFIDFFNR